MAAKMTFNTQPVLSLEIKYLTLQSLGKSLLIPPSLSLLWYPSFQNGSLLPSTLAEKHLCSLFGGWGKERRREARAEIYPESIFINENLFAVKQISHLWYLRISFDNPHLLIIPVGCNVHSIKWAINTARVIAAHNSQQRSCLLAYFRAFHTFLLHPSHVCTKREKPKICFDVQRKVSSLIQQTKRVIAAPKQSLPLVPSSQKMYLHPLSSSRQKPRNNPQFLSFNDFIKSISKAKSTSWIFFQISIFTATIHTRSVSLG